MASYDPIFFNLDVDNAARHIAERVSHIRRTQNGNVVQYSTNVGIHLATLSGATLRSWVPGAKLRYRTSLIRPHPIHAHHKAKEIRESGEEFRVTR